MPKGEGIWQRGSHRLLELLDINHLVFHEKKPRPWEMVWCLMAKDTLEDLKGHCSPSTADIAGLD